VRVDVSIDGGRSWTSAALTEGSEQKMHRAWAWTFWECEVTVPGSKGVPSGGSAAAVAAARAGAAAPEELEIICKAVDAAHNVQPDSVGGIWNLRGINNNAWHRVKVRAVVPKEEE
jgi:sulfite oxidase